VRASPVRSLLRTAMNLHLIAWWPVLDTGRHGYGCAYPQSAHPTLARAAIPALAIVRLASKSRLDRRGSNLVKRFSLRCRSASRPPNPQREQLPPPKRKTSESRAVSAKVNARSGAIHPTRPGRAWLHCPCGADRNSRIQGQARLRVSSQLRSRLAGRHAAAAKDASLPTPTVDCSRVLLPAFPPLRCRRRFTVKIGYVDNR
jgi:hypothetical protein